MATQSVSTGKLLDQSRQLVDRLYDAWFRAYYRKDDDTMVRARWAIEKAERRARRRFAAKQAA